ncbi:MAG: hypothetical protein ACXWF4_10330, partial [Candidatus Aminicenantales bacterium]
HLNQAVDKVRRAESVRLRGRPLAARLKKMRWHLLRRGSRVRGHARIKLHGFRAFKRVCQTCCDPETCVADHPDGIPSEELALAPCPWR